MRLQRISVKRFRLHDEYESPRLGDITAIIGVNGIGKSSLIQALLLPAGSRGMHDLTDLPAGVGSPETNLNSLDVSLTFDFDLEGTMAEALSDRDLIPRLQEYCEKELALIEATVASHPERAPGYHSFKGVMERPLRYIQNNTPFAEVLAQSLSAKVLQAGRLLRVSFSMEYARGPSMSITLMDENGTVVAAENAPYSVLTAQKEYSDHIALVYVLMGTVVRGVGGKQPYAPLEKPQTGAMRPNMSNLPHCLVHLRAHDSARLARIQEWFHEVFGRTIEFRTTEPTADGGLTLEVRLSDETGRSNWFAFEKLSDGMTRGLAIFYQISPNGPGVVIIDEPELHLHPGAMRGLRQILRKRPKGCQLLLATHAPSFFDPAVADTILLHRRVSGKLQVKSVQPSGLDLDIALRELGISGVDLLLYDAVIWVEGPSDAIYLECLIHAFGGVFKTLWPSRIGVQPFGGTGNLYHLKPDGIKKLNRRNLVLIDKDDGPSPRLQKFIRECEESGIQCKIWDRRAIENYVPASVLESIHHLPSETLVVRDTDDIKTLLTRAGRSLNKIALARAVTEQPYLSQFLEVEALVAEIAAIFKRLDEPPVEDTP